MTTGKKLDLSFIRQWADRHGRLLTGKMDHLRLYTALQPIYSLAHKRVVGYEALLRAKNDQNIWVSPGSLFDARKEEMQQIHLDRLCRYIHINNFICAGDTDNWLFLNVSAPTITSGKKYGAYFEDLIHELDFPAHRIVIEVVEQPTDNNDRLMETVVYYKSLGCLIAIDDFGAGHSNFDRIWTLKPDIVKLDRSFLVKAVTQSSAMNVLTGIVSLLHQAGALVLLEGIETREQALMAVESDADFVQGFYFAKPFINMMKLPEVFGEFDALFEEYKTGSIRERQMFQERVKVYNAIFLSVIDGLKQGDPLEKACEALLEESKVVRCYQIGTDGIQIGQTAVPAHYRINSDNRFRPLDDARSADWFRRHYFRRAILYPEQIQVTRPYLSITGAHMCMTLSMRFSDGAKDSVLCCDLRV